KTLSRPIYAQGLKVRVRCSPSAPHSASLKRGFNQRFGALFAACLALAGISGFSATFTEANNVVLIEAENFATNLSPRSSHTWGLSNSVAGFSGSGYMEAAPNTGANITSGWLSSSPELDYSVQLTNGGTYYVWIRAYATAGTDDSIHAGLDNATNTADAITLTA